MLEIINETPFKVFALPIVCKDDSSHVVVVVKGTFELNRNKSLPTLSEEQMDILFENVLWGESENSSVKYESDMAHARSTTNVSLLGHAWATNQNQTSLDVGIKIGSLSKVIKVTGDRIWEKRGQSYYMSSPVPFEKIPLTYENAFGGTDAFHQNPKVPGFEQRNPVGKGFIINVKENRLDGLALPNLEYSSALINNWRDKPVPAGFGVIAQHWMPRKLFVGTYNDEWLKKRKPLLPTDFDNRYYDCAADDMKTSAFLQGGEVLQVVNASREGSIDCLLPTICFNIESSIDDKKKFHEMQLDTIVVEPDENRVVLSWRTSFPCHWNLAKVQWIKIKLEQCDVAV